ncbi:ABC transporter permease [Virgibacillus byunsanensis]|uniref:ABC transporter permease n=1 Tax=Virgibacillus byunsanensis TaxID=570945 RepID=A0ABW3LP40_9BACI
MKNIITTRFIHWKKQWLSLLFWLCFPIVVTISITILTASVQEDAQVPVGIVIEDETPMVVDLLKKMKQASLIDVYEMDESVALHKLRKHELDSVFIIHEGYEEEIRKGNRDRLITAYQSDLSFAYTPAKELIISYIQQETGRSKAAYVVKDLGDSYQQDQQWSWDEIVDKSIEIQAEENLLHTSFAFLNSGSSTADHQQTVWDIWSLWAVASLLATFLLFDWIIKENREHLKSRFLFMRFSFKNYVVFTFFLYTLLLWLLDCLTIVMFQLFLGENTELLFVLDITFYRTMINIAALLLALCFRNVLYFYGMSFVITMVLGITSGAIIPIDNFSRNYPWIEWFNPIGTFLTNEKFSFLFVILILLFIWWYVRKENSNA